MTDMIVTSGLVFLGLFFVADMVADLLRPVVTTGPKWVAPSEY